MVLVDSEVMTVPEGRVVGKLPPPPTFHPNPLHVNECVATSWRSHDRWRNSLRRGCLNKSTGEKLKIFSHLKIMTTQSDLPIKSLWEEQLGVGGPIEETDSDSILTDWTRGSMLCDLMHLPYSKSAVIVEDISTPPRENEDAVTWFFTADEFFSFMSDPTSGRPKILRVIGGQLLIKLLTALYALEARDEITSKVGTVMLNNGHYKQTIVRNSTGSRCSETNEWVDERILIRTVYYSRVSEKVAANRTSSSSPRRMFPHGIPYHHRLLAVDRLKLPAGEEYDPRARIAQLENEITDLKEKQEIEATEDLLSRASKHAKAVTKSKSRKSTVILDKLKKTLGKIEDVAEDPYLNTEQGKVEDVAIDPFLDSEKRKVEDVALDPYLDSEKSEIEDVAVDPYLDHEQSQILPGADKDSEEAKETRSSTIDGGVVVKEQVDGNEEIPNQSMTSLIEKGSLGKKDGLESKTSQSTDSKTHWSDLPSEPKKRLYVSGDELYISGLYAPLAENAQPAAHRLHQANQIKLNRRHHAAKSRFHDFSKGRDIDLSSRFQCLAKTKEREEKERIPASQYEPMGQDNNITDKWSAYFKGQENMEMKVATESQFQTGVLNRLAASHMSITNKQDVDKEQKTGKQGQSQNNNKNFNSKARVQKNGKKDQVFFVEDLVSKAEIDKYSNKTGALTNKQNRHAETAGSLTRSSEYNIHPLPSFTPRACLTNRNLSNPKTKVSTGDKDSFHSCRNNQVMFTNAQNASKSARHASLQRFPVAVTSNIKSRGNLFEISKETEKTQTPLSFHNEICKKHISMKADVGKRTIHSRLVDVFRAQHFAKHNFLQTEQVVANNNNMTTPQDNKKTIPNETICNQISSRSPSSLFKTSNQICRAERSSQNLKGSNDKSNRILESRAKNRQLSKPLNRSFRRSSQVLTENTRSSRQASLAEKEQSGETLTHANSHSSQILISESKENREENEVSNSPPQPTESEILHHDLARFKTACQCRECQNNETILSGLQPDCRQLPFTYPPKLGCLKRPCPYSKGSVSPHDAIWDNEVNSPGKGERWLQDNILTLLDTVVIRKDVRVSSLGHTYTTLVFA